MSTHELQAVQHPGLLQPGTHRFSIDISEALQRGIASVIWGRNDVANTSNDMLEHFFQHYVDQTLAMRAGLPRRLTSSSTSLTQINTHEQLNKIIDTLKKNHSKSRKDLRALLTSDDLPNYDINTALDLAVRVVLMISCRSSVHSITTGHKCRPAWKDTESLAALVERVLPRHEVEPLERTESIKAHKLRARYLKEYTHIRIKWTDNLPDHLYLQVTENWKTIQVFGQVGFLATSLRALDDASGDISLEESLGRGCLTPQLLSETLRTIWLLFPEDDIDSSKYLQQAVLNEGVDPGFLRPLEIFCNLHEHPQSLSPPEDMRDLFEKFPHWGERLYKIMREVEHPTPMTWYERWSDRRTAPRHTYWAGIVALIFALFFGITATILGALQVVMTYCAWLGDAGPDACLAMRKGKAG